MSEALVHNPSNPVTVGIWRVPWAGGTAIRKVIGGREPTRHPDWHASNDPRSWLYWRREAEVYRTDLPASYRGSGVRAPQLLHARDLPDDRIELKLEDVPGRTGAALTRADEERFALRLGRAQGAVAQALDRSARPWTSRSFLRDHCAAKHVQPALLDDPDAWRHPLIASTWPASLQPGLQQLHASRQRLFELGESAPRTLCHLDCWPNNLVQPDGEADSVLIDWAFCGDGALGEDLGNWLAEAALDELTPTTDLRERTAVLLARYQQGVAASGWTGDPRLVELGLTASAVKWHWLGPLHLERAQTGEHHLYGGRDDPDPARQYVARGQTLAVLCDWAERALRLGRALGL